MPDSSHARAWTAIFKTKKYETDLQQKKHRAA